MHNKLVLILIISILALNIGCDSENVKNDKLVNENTVNENTIKEEKNVLTGEIVVEDLNSEKIDSLMVLELRQVNENYFVITTEYSEQLGDSIGFYEYEFDENIGWRSVDLVKMYCDKLDFNINSMLVSGQIETDEIEVVFGCVKKADIDSVKLNSKAQDVNIEWDGLDLFEVNGIKIWVKDISYENIKDYKIEGFEIQAFNENGVKMEITNYTESKMKMKSKSN